MKSVIFVAMCMAVLVFAEDKYDAETDDINLSEVLSNERLLTAYSKCLINKGPCTPEIKKLKDKLPEILETQCAKCTEKQKQRGKSVTKELRDKRPEIWAELINFYDPQGKYQKSFEEFLKS